MRVVIGDVVVEDVVEEVVEEKMVHQYVSLSLSRAIFKLLGSKSENIRVQALKVLGYFLKHLGHK